MAETLLSFGVEKLWDLLVRESDRFQGVKKQFNELRSDLNKLRCFLEDADAKKHQSAMVSNTVKEVKEIVYDTEDIIETFLRKKQLGRTRGMKKRIKEFACVLPDRRKIAIDMEGLSKRIAKVICDMQSLGVQQVIVNDEYMQSLQERQRNMRQTFSNNNESALVGLEENVKKLVGHLVEVEDSSQVVSITGMGGIGKTTLARQVFNHETVKSHFAQLAWVCVSQQFTRKYVWQTILRKVGPEYIKLEMTEDELQEKLFRLLGTRKALIVLDDIWREEDWDMIEPIFPLGKGWKVLLTSRNEGVALRANPNGFIFKPDCLTPEESWTIFRRIVFPGENTTGKLSIYIRGRLNMKTLSSSLSKLRDLENLTICYYPMYAPMSGIEGLVLDCDQLKHLNLRIYMPRLPDEQHFPWHLRNISLAECCLKEDPMPILEKLLQLNEVSLSHQSFCGKRMVCSDGGFPQLQKLDLCGLEEWEEWIVEEGSMPRLRKLTIRNDPKLKELPDGLKFITSLKEVHVILNNWDFKKKLSRGGEDYYKVQHIPLVRFL